MNNEREIDYFLETGKETKNNVVINSSQGSLRDNLLSFGFETKSHNFFHFYFDFQWPGKTHLKSMLLTSKYTLLKSLIKLD